MKTQQIEQPQRKIQPRLHRSFRALLLFCLGSAIVGMPTLTGEASSNEAASTLLFGQPLSPPPAPTAPRQIDYFVPDPFSTAPVEANPTFYSQPVVSQSVVGAERYLVLVRSADPLVLQQVRILEPGAFTRFYDGQTVIQAGNFIDFANAQQRVNQLAQQGLGGEIIASGSVGGTTLAAPFSTAPVADPYSLGTPVSIPVVSPAPTTGYFVVVPSGRDIQPVLASQVVRLVGDSSLVRTRDVPIGPHVAVGPFRERGLAERWNRYFRDFGLDARVFFGQ